MTRFPHDQFAKDFLESLLSPLGEVQTSLKVSGEVRETVRSLISIEPFELTTTESVFQVLPKMRSRSNSSLAPKITSETKRRRFSLRAETIAKYRFCLIKSGM